MTTETLFITKCIACEITPYRKKITFKEKMGGSRGTGNFVLIGAVLSAILAIAYYKFFVYNGNALNFMNMKGDSPASSTASKTSSSGECKLGFGKDGVACLSEEEVASALDESEAQGENEDSSSSSTSSSKTSGGAKVAKNANEKGKPREAEKQCVDRYPKECPNWKKQGECLKNPGWMIIYCAKSCNKITNSCKKRDPKLRCDRKALNISDEPIYVPGDLDKMFSTLVERYSDKHEVNVLSTDPWVVTIDNFVTDEQADALINQKSLNWERSTDTGSTNEFGETGRILSQGRTSTNAWCVRDCESDPMVREMLHSIEVATYVPTSHYESFQVLKYEVGQHYRVHHDFGYEDNELICGPRILTFFLYLSDVEEGGETGFSNLKLDVKPKKGRALIWPSVLNNNLKAREERTYHEAKPVIKGLKFAANSWIHLYDYNTPNLWGCTGSFDELD